jgi:hypothetical protein
MLMIMHLLVDSAMEPPLAVVVHLIMPFASSETGKNPRIVFIPKGELLSFQAGHEHLTNSPSKQIP